MKNKYEMRPAVRQFPQRQKPFPDIVQACETVVIQEVLDGNGNVIRRTYASQKKISHGTAPGGLPYNKYK